MLIRKWLTAPFLNGVIAMFLAAALTALSTLSLANEKNVEIDKLFQILQQSFPAKGQLLNIPYTSELNIYGKKIKSRHVHSEDVFGQQAFEVKVKKPGKNPWDQGVYAKIIGEINQGDVIHMVFWARAPKFPKDLAYTTLQGVGIQNASPPYDNILSKTVHVKEEWKKYSLTTIANKSFMPHASQIAFQVGEARHTIEFGPIFVFNFGKDVPIEKLMGLTSEM